MKFFLFANYHAEAISGAVVALFVWAVCWLVETKSAFLRAVMIGAMFFTVGHLTDWSGHESIVDRFEGEQVRFTPPPGLTPLREATPQLGRELDHITPQIPATRLPIERIATVPEDRKPPRSDDGEVLRSANSKPRTNANGPTIR